MQTALLMGQGHGGYERQQLGDAASVSANIAKGASAGAALVEAGVIAQGVPVIGNILGAAAIVAGAVAAIFSARKIAKQLDKQRKEYDKALKVLRDANAQADISIQQASQQIESIKAQLRQYGLSGIDQVHLGSWFQKTFTPKKNAEKNLASRVKQFEKESPVLEAELDKKLKTLQSMENELKRLQLLLKTGKSVEAGGTVLGVVAILVLAGMAFSKPKKKEEPKQ